MSIFFIHWIAWLLLHFITFIPALVNAGKMSLEAFVFNHFVLVTINFLLFYITAFYMMPYMAMLQKKWFRVVIASLLLAILFTYLKFIAQTVRDEHLLKNRPLDITHLESLSFLGRPFLEYFQANILVSVSIVVVAFAYRLLLIWLQHEKVKSDLQNQKLRAELSFLRMQVNPHFLFNALNNIYALSVIENTTRTSNSILKLSDLMRYMLYEPEDSENKVNLAKEIHHINSYIDLEKLRHAEDIYVSFSIEGDVDKKRIAPLLLFPLIENAFKHGILTEKEKPLIIELKILDDQLHLRIDNFNNHYEKDKAGGIGIQNVKKRLDLLYQDNYKLDVDHTKDRYIVNLNLPL